MAVAIADVVTDVSGTFPPSHQGNEQRNPNPNLTTALDFARGSREGRDIARASVTLLDVEHRECGSTAHRAARFECRERTECPPTGSR